MKVLLLDDKMERTQDIDQILNEQGMELHCVRSLESAEKDLKNNNYSVVVVDLWVPRTLRDRKVYSTAGFEFVQYIFESTEDFNRPERVIVVSDNFSEIEYMAELIKYPVSIVDTSVSNWKSDFIKTINSYLMKVKPVDVAIVTAVDIEFKTVYESFSWEEDLKSGTCLFYRTNITNSRGNNLTLLLVKPERKGMLPTSIAIDKLFSCYRPQKVVMLGICAGNPSETNSCDIVVATSSCDYSNGAIYQNDNNEIEFEIDPASIEISDSLKAIFTSYSIDKHLAFQLRENTGMDYDRDISIKLGPMVCGPLVLKSSDFIDKFIRPHNRKYYAIDMESFALYYTCKNRNCNDFIVIKSVSDHGNRDKSDLHQKFCVKLTIELLKHYINKNL